VRRSLFTAAVEPWRAALIASADHRASIVTREAVQIISERCQPERETK